MPTRPNTAQTAADDDVAGDRQSVQSAFKKLALDEFGVDMQVGLALALFHTFASPPVASLLTYTGHVHANADKRTVDTSLFVYEMIYGGMEGTRGRGIIRKLNQLHGKWDIANDDFLFVLSVFVVTPVEWIDACAWRRTTAEERQTTVDFYRRMGRLMGMKDLPRDYQGFVDFLDGYHQTYLAPTANAAELTRATMPLIGARLTRGLRPLAPELLTACLRPEVSRCLGLRDMNRFQRAIIRTGLRRASVFTKPGTPLARPWFFPGGPVAEVYPDGYDLEALGPQSPRA